MAALNQELACRDKCFLRTAFEPEHEALQFKRRMQWRWIDGWGPHSGRARRVQFSKTVSESDVYLFAGITGDLAPNHVDKSFMEKSVYGERIAHGALMVGFMSNCSTMILQDVDFADRTPVSLGYDRIRFLKPVLIGDTITVVYEIVAVDAERYRSTSDIKITNQRDELVTIAQHILKWVANPTDQ